MRNQDDDRKPLRENASNKEDRETETGQIEAERSVRAKERAWRRVSVERNGERGGIRVEQSFTSGF